MVNKLVSFAILLLVFLAGCKNSGNNTSAEKENYQKAIEKLGEKERKAPVNFLSVSNKDRHNLIGQTVIKGNVSNNAKVCTYKDVVLSFSFYSKTGTLLLTTSETVYDNIAPGKSAAFKTKEFAPKGTDSVVIKVTGAKTTE